MRFVGRFGLHDLILLEFQTESALHMGMFQCLADHFKLFEFILGNKNLLVTQDSLTKSCILSYHLKVFDNEALDQRFSLQVVQLWITDGFEEFIVVWLITF